MGSVLRDLELIFGAEPAEGLLVFTLYKQTDTFKSYKVVVPIGRRLEADAILFLNNMEPRVGEMVESEIKNDGQIVLLIFVAEMKKTVYSADNVYGNRRENHIVKQTIYLRSEAVPVINDNDTKEMIKKSSAHIIESVNDYVHNGSGWRLSRHEVLFGSFAKYCPLRGKSYIKTPAYIPKRAAINVKIRIVDVSRGQSSLKNISRVIMLTVKLNTFSISESLNLIISLSQLKLLMSRNSSAKCQSSQSTSLDRKMS